MSEVKLIFQVLNDLENIILEAKGRCGINLMMLKEYPDKELNYQLKEMMERTNIINGAFFAVEMTARSIRDRLTEQEKMQTTHGGMRVDLNASRKRALSEYTAIVKFTEEMMEKKEIPDSTDCDRLKDFFDGLRSSLLSLAYTYIPDDPDFRDLADEIGDVPVFMEDDE